MKLNLNLPTDVSIALRKAAHELETDVETAATALLKDALRAGGNA